MLAELDPGVKDCIHHLLDYIAHFISVTDMIRYVNSGKREYNRFPVHPYSRGVIEFQAVLEGAARPTPGDIPGLTAPCLWVHPAYSVHGWTDHREGISRVAVFHFWEVDEEFTGLLSRHGRLEVSLTEEQGESLEQLAVRTRKDFGGRETLAARMWFEKVRAELCWIALKGRPQPPSGRIRPRAVWMVEDALRLYRERVRENPTVEDIARKAGLSPSHLRRLFHRVLNESPRHRFRQIRLETARRELIESQRPIAEVAEDWGFSEPASFSRAYRQVFHRSPTSDRQPSFPNRRPL